VGSYEVWLERDRNWVDQNLPLLKEVFQWFLKEGDWPKVEELQLQLHQQGDRTTKVRDVANSRPTFAGLAQPSVMSHIPLGARHLFKMPEARTLLAVTVAATKAAVRVYLTTPRGTQPRIDSSMITTATLGQIRALELFPAFINGDHPTPFLGPGGDPWSAGVEVTNILRYEHVDTPEDYVACQLEIIRRWCQGFDARAVPAKRTGPFRAFIIMPFKAPWSDDSHELIMRLLDTIDEQIVPIRADKIPNPGRVNDQIISELNVCDFVIGDISEINANVFWELGYAEATGKPCVLLRRNDASIDPPFDIYVNRRVDYSEPPTLEEEELILSLMNGAIQQVRDVETAQASQRIYGGLNFK
jgi:hypothetical protein